MHRATDRFWKLYESFPQEIRDIADKNYQLLKENPRLKAADLEKFRNLRRKAATVGSVKVFQAHDVNLEREVAIKLLKTIF